MSDDASGRPFSRRKLDILDSAGDVVATVADRIDQHDDEAEANAELIVRAVNAHDDLAAVAQAVLTNSDISCRPLLYQDLIQTAKAALDKAKKGGGT